MGGADNAALAVRLQSCWELLDSGRASVPLQRDEFGTNPFLRTHIPEVIVKAEEIAGRETHTPADIFAVLRIWKDTEYELKPNKMFAVKFQFFNRVADVVHCQMPRFFLKALG